MNGKPTVRQQWFHDWARRYGCIVDKSEHPAIHHISGSKMKLKGVKSAGEWFIIPLSYYWHQDGTNPSAVHVNKYMFELENGLTQREMWVELMEGYKLEKGEYPMPDHEYQIIKDRG